MYKSKILPISIALWIIIFNKILFSFPKDIYLTPKQIIELNNVIDLYLKEETSDSIFPPYNFNLTDLTSYKPGLYEPSEFLYGTIVVGVIFIKGDKKYDWTFLEKEIAKEDIKKGTDYWVIHAPYSNLSFVFDYKEVLLGYDPRDYPSSEWVTDVMEALNYANWYDYIDNVYHYNNDLRTSYKTNWAFTLFIYDAGASFKKFDDKFYNYAYIGGPYIAFAYNKVAGAHFWNPAILAHEIGHIFYAYDEYEEAQRKCTDHIGYLNVENQNSEFGECLLKQHCIMRGSLKTVMQGLVNIDTPVCYYTQGQIGIWDTDKDNIQDILDTPPIIKDVKLEKISDSKYKVSGIAKVTALPNQNPYGTQKDITFAYISSVYYSVDNGKWIIASPKDGKFDGEEENFSFETNWSSSLRIKGINSVGNESQVYYISKYDL